MLDPLEVRVDSHVAWVRFGDPAQHNLLTVPLLEALPEALSEAESRHSRVVVLRGRGDVWSAGYDVAQIPPQIFSDDPETVAAHAFERCMRAVGDCRLVTIAAIRGAAFGGALELAASCDLRITHEDARLGLPPAKLGIVYSHTGLQKLLGLLGGANTRMLVFTGCPVGAREAERIGLVNRAVAGHQFDAVVEKLARDVAACAPLAVQGMKQVLRIVERGTPVSETDVRTILRLRNEAYRSEDFQEGQNAFTEKRKPRFRGR
ncbi:MAG: enoyl-CoA hydratase/isomerase family protein [Candidatus Krumholzibacteriia bacterium]